MASEDRIMLKRALVYLLGETKEERPYYGRPKLIFPFWAGPSHHSVKSAVLLLGIDPVHYWVDIVNHYSDAGGYLVKSLKMQRPGELGRAVILNYKSRVHD